VAFTRITLAMTAMGLAVVVGSFSDAPKSAAHGGGLDRYGCHRDNKAGNYHCHRGGCSGKTFANQAAMLADRCSKT